jgi:alpha-galactosidase
VICSAAPQLRERFAADCELIGRLLPQHVITEFGGVAGLSYSARQIAFMQTIAESMRRRCPKAWFLTVSNPLPRTCQAMHEMGIRTAGFCSAALEGYSMLWHLFEGENIAFPFDEARSRWEATMGGLNHFSWVLGLRDRQTGEDLLGEVRKRLEKGASSGWPHSDEISRRVGYLMVPNDHHTQDFLPPRPNAVNRGHASHGNEDQRRERIETLRGVGSGRLPLETVTGRLSWEKPVDMIAGLLGGRVANFEGLNLVNDSGQVPGLPPQVFVETPADVAASGPVPASLDIPERVMDLLGPTAEQTDRIVKACLNRDREALLDCVEQEPTILNKSGGRVALNECLNAHADLIGEWD